MADDEVVPSTHSSPGETDVTVPHSARIWNHWLGGKDNYLVDREAGDAFRELYPGIVDGTRVARQFLARAVRHLTGDVGIRQFLDIGTGLPNIDNTHEIAQRLTPESRIVYVDNDPLVLAHARTMLTSTPEGATSYIDADLHDPDAIVREAARTLDFSRPIALMLMGILGHVTDYDEARSIVRRLTGALPSGSHLVHYDSTDTDPAYVEAIRHYNEGGSVPYHLAAPSRSRASPKDSNCWSPAWSRVRCGGRRTAATTPRWISTEASAASRDPSRARVAPQRPGAEYSVGETAFQPRPKARALDRSRPKMRRGACTRSRTNSFGNRPPRGTVG